MNSYSIRPNVFLQAQDVHLSRTRALVTPHTSARLGHDVACVRDLVFEALAHFAAAWAAARARRAIVQQLKPMDQRLLADVGIDYPNLRESVDALMARQARADARLESRPARPLTQAVGAGA